VQVFGDGRGGAVHFFERDCSGSGATRKCSREAPAPGLDAKNGKNGRGGGRAARAIKYGGPARSNSSPRPMGIAPERSAPVLLHGDEYALQVEHAVTEMITGLDARRMALRVAAAKAFPCARSS